MQNNYIKIIISSIKMSRNVLKGLKYKDLNKIE